MMMIMVIEIRVIVTVGKMMKYHIDSRNHNSYNSQKATIMMMMMLMIMFIVTFACKH